MSSFSRSSIPVVNSIDPLLDDNIQRHRTSRYRWQRTSKFIIRRGKPFRLELRLGSPLNSEHDIDRYAWILRLQHFGPDTDSEYKDIIIATSKLITLENHAPISSEWNAELIDNNRYSMTVDLTIPTTAPIAKWTLRVLTGEYGYDDRIVRKYESQSAREVVFFSICNPFNPADDAYIDDSLQPYLDTTVDGWYEGNYSVEPGYSKNENIWIHSQFDEDTMDTVAWLIWYMVDPIFRFGFHRDCGDLVMLTRRLSFVINYRFLAGKWDKPYYPGYEPTYWRGTAELVRQFGANDVNQKVRYGQCFTFANVFVTFLRTIGIASRGVTCIASAHDGDSNLTIDKKIYIYENGEMSQPVENPGSEESIWNFHMWTEAWFKRRDLDRLGEFDGWQVVDATPQATSDGLLQCGPTSVKALRKGCVDSRYDATFVYAEVNADVVYWKFRKDRYGREVLVEAMTDVDAHDVGRAVLTRDPVTKSVIKLTSDYKALETTSEERQNHLKALKNAGVFQRNKLIEKMYGKRINRRAAGAFDIILTGPDLPSVEYGQPIRGTFKLLNNSLDLKSVNLCMTVTTQIHTGKNEDTVAKQLEVLKIPSGDTQQVTIEVPFTKYINLVTGNQSMALIFTANIVETDQVLYQENRFFVDGGPLELTVKKDKSKVGELIEADVKFRNFLPDRMTNVELFVDGGPLKDKKKMTTFPRTVPGDSQITFLITLKFDTSGERVITATAKSDQMKEFSANKVVEVLDSTSI
uniref:TGc domain-containing protein n=1 Tax=Panagrellus redivivus TaxID=6233 RepID=A0A7E4VBM9_PANRE